MKRRIFSCTLWVILIVSVPYTLPAQNFQEISGTVYDSSANTGISEVSVSVKGSTRGVSTGTNGRYRIQASPSDKLIFSTVGYKDQEVTVGNRSVIDVIMSGKSAILQDVIVNVGYGTQKRTDVTGSVASISSKQITELPLTNFQQALQGRAPGIDVVSNGTAPGSGVTVRIRGRRSFSAGNDPLYVLDGIPMTGDMTDINPNDIESMDVLKDASATAIYGSRGANGVVLITTKKGKTGKPVLSYSMYTGITTPQGKYNVMNGKEYKKYRIEAFRTIGQEPPWAPIEVESMAIGRSTNWQDMILDNGFKQQHDLNISGGTENTKYSVSGGFFNEKGVISLQDFTRYNLKISVSQNVGKKLKLGFSSFTSLSKRNGENFSPLSDALNLSPLTVPYDSSGKLIFFPNPSETIMKNPLSDLVPGALVDETKQSRLFASLYAEYNITNDLSARVNFGPSLSTTRNGRFSASQTSLRSEGLPAASTMHSSEFSYTVENILNYKKKIGEHSFGATALFSVQSDEFERFSSSVEGVTADPQQFYNLGSASTILSVGSDYSKWAILSYMGRLNYSYKERYLLTATVRADGSSRFAPGHQWGYFPSMALAWKISEENFMKNFAFLPELKIRAGYGRTGNTGINPYATQGSLGRTAYAFGETSAFGFHPSVFRNLNLKWESTGSFNLGVDFSLFRYRINGSVDFYHQNTTDLLMNRQIPANTGFTSILSNIGATQNQGLEISLSTVNINSPGGFKWQTDFTFYTNREKIVSLSTGKKDDPQNAWFIGKPLTVYYDYEKIGIWQSKEEGEAAGYNAVPGQIKLKDQDNNGEINSLDKVVLGSDIPKWTGGMTNRLNYKAFDFSIFVYTRQGSMIQSNYHESLATLSGKSNVMNMDYWTPENPTNMWPRPNKNQERPTNGSTLGYFSGSFVKIRNMQLGYNFSRGLLDRLRMQSLRIYVSAQQPFILFSPYVNKYYGIDPEFDRNMGINTPQTKIFMLGLNARF
ncbi:SusC/RagA family TonB-linked outer membrane protein [Segetibacter koreensis]|uniref:SusC/RagA family TonB-linked outer membrane protein n=1 Tax=Segetibacter koreensis TaxID=398037 RepID=UPI000363B01D|nr:TonB-dependent receptor [Segetibacter koreensis]